MEINKKELQFKILGLYYSNSLSVKDVVRNYQIQSKDFTSNLSEDEKYYAENNMSLKVEDNDEKNKMMSNVLEVIGALYSIKTFDDEAVDNSLIEKLQEVVNYMQI
jgi:hypothetical protein